MFPITYASLLKIYTHSLPPILHADWSDNSLSVGFARIGAVWGCSEENCLDYNLFDNNSLQNISYSDLNYG